TGADDDDALVKPVKSAAKRAGSKAGKPKSDGATQRKRRKDGADAKYRADGPGYGGSSANE
ncbi:hypothetical protein IWW55_002236, partial [Coemansia sp. RSA 2706]